MNKNIIYVIYLSKLQCKFSQINYIFQFFSILKSFPIKPVARPLTAAADWGMLPIRCNFLHCFGKFESKMFLPQKKKVTRGKIPTIFPKNLTRHFFAFLCYFDEHLVHIVC